MLSRRAFCCGLPIAGFIASAVPGPAVASGDPACAAYTPDRLKATTPDDAIAMLKAGHERFITGQSIHCDLMHLVHETEGGQAPFAAIVGCMDSRVPPELVFDQQIGDIFTIRVAGNVVNTDIVGSLEYACKVVGTKAIVVLGHSSCGAVKGAIDGVSLGSLTSLFGRIEPAIASTHRVGEKSSKNHEFVQAVADTNVELQAAVLPELSSVLKELVDAGALKIVGAMHDVHTGKVVFYG
ncbi:carbonic anhydrase family protein [Chthonobacter albigriseus]|uniref:carbonic anhydrase family protein n=1 Tax=Chthonobacter albigriseus TaxID=1683161 RepID=UPI0015EEC56B|nr:carbonic anhydrase family protein [Chthonobacter albigriseus]